MMERKVFTVDGVETNRPFQINRLGHFGINVIDPQASLSFYEKLLGLEISDKIDFSPRVPQPLQNLVGPTEGYFTRFGTDHHSFVLFPKRAVHAFNMHYVDYSQLSMNQLTWQVGSLEQVINGHHWFEEQRIKILRSGRDLPGSNWHFYAPDPAGHINELYYGIEQIGWDGLSKPKTMHAVSYQQPPELPHISEFTEVNRALKAGHHLQDGWRRQEQFKETYNVGGTLLARPFKVTKVGPVHLFVEDYEAAKNFYTEVMGLRISEEIVYDGQTCLFLRANTEHHSLAIFPMELQKQLKLPLQSSTLSFGFRVGSYQQLLDAYHFLKEQGQIIVQLPVELSPGVGHHFYVIDPDGFCVQIYFEMEQVGWDGRTKPQHLRRTFSVSPENWPLSIPAQSDTFDGEVFMGPLN
jgi:catechol 2,3-dioxygenase-like lactoylglutathione lyase family enzyme